MKITAGIPQPRFALELGHQDLCAGSIVFGRKGVHVHSYLEDQSHWLHPFESR